MKTTRRNISELKAPEKNVRIHTKKQIEEFVRSIKMFGQIRPVVIDEKDIILAGNGLVEALLAMGATEADTLVMENLTENQKKKLMIADNKIFSLGIENLETLNAFLEELQGDLDIPGFDEDILKTMVADGEEVTQKIAEYGTLDDDEIEEIKRAGERKALQEEKPPEQLPLATAVPDDAPADDREETTDIRKSVVCPKCGEEIWL